MPSSTLPFLCQISSQNVRWIIKVRSRTVRVHPPRIYQSVHVYTPPESTAWLRWPRSARISDRVQTTDSAAPWLTEGDTRGPNPLKPYQLFSPSETRINRDAMKTHQLRFPVGYLTASTIRSQRLTGQRLEIVWLPFEFRSNPTRPHFNESCLRSVPNVGRWRGILPREGERPGDDCRGVS